MGARRRRDDADDEAQTAPDRGEARRRNRRALRQRAGTRRTRTQGRLDSATRLVARQGLEPQAGHDSHRSGGQHRRRSARGQQPDDQEGSQAGKQRDQLVTRPWHTGEQYGLRGCHRVQDTGHSSFRPAETPDPGRLGRVPSKVGGMPLSGEYAPSPLDWSREQAEKYAASGGTEGTEMQGKPVILLTTIGAKTGKLRKTPLMRVEHNGEYAIVASLGGAPKNPVWYYNVKKNPRVELQDGAVSGDYEAREVFGDEKAVWRERAVEAWPDYAKYQTKTDRQIPVFVLTPVH